MTLSCHYTASTLSSFTIPSEFRYLVAAFGPYGYELDLTKLSEEEKTKLKVYTEKYREIERFNIDCDLYRLISPQTDWFSAYMQVTKDKKQALLTFLQFTARSLKGRITIKLKGLDENTVYENTETGMRMTGGGWMHVGVIIDRLMYDKSGSGKQIVFRAVE